MSGKSLDGFPVRDRCPSGHAGDDHALGDAGQRIFHVQGCGRTAEGAYARGGIIGDPLRLQKVHLLPDSAVDAGISGVQAHCRKAFLFCSPHHFDHFLQRHLRAVIDTAAVLLTFQQRRIHQRPGVNDHVRLADEPLPPHCDEIRRSGSRSHKMNHIARSCYFRSVPAP